MLFPQARREELDLESGMSINPLPHLDEGDRGLDALQAARGAQARHDADGARPDFGPTEQPVPPTQREGANLALQVMSVQWNLRILQKHFQCLRPFQGVAGRVGEGIGGQQGLRAAALLEPDKEGGHPGLAVLGPVSRLGLRCNPALTDPRVVRRERSDAGQGLGDQRGFGPFRINEVPPGMTPTLGVDEAGDGLDKAVVDEVAVCDSYATETAQRLPHHCARAGGRTGEGALVRVTVEGPAIAGV